MRYPDFTRALPLIALALLLLGGPIACDKTEEAEEAPETTEVAADSIDTPAAPVPMSADDLPTVVARLNGDDLPREDLIAFAQGLQQRMVQSGINPGPTTAEFYRSALDQMVGGVLLYNEAVATGRGPSDEEVAAQYDMMKAQFPSQEAFDQALASQNVSAEMVREDIARSIAVQNLIDQEITPSISVTPEAARNYYDANLEQMMQPEQIAVRHILVRVEEGASEETRAAAREKADALLQRALDGEDFASLAQTSSDDVGSAQRGGELGWIARGQTVPPFEQAAFGLQPSQLSGVVESPFGYHIIRLDDRRAESQMAFEEVSAGIQQMLTRQAMEGAINQRIETLRSSADLEVFI
jgi:parvulin-like peptidyl-prolyl isomerase